MTAQNISLSFLLLAMGLWSPRSVSAQILADVAVDVSEANGLFTYVYTVNNNILSGTSVNALLLTVAAGTDVVEPNGVIPPQGWVGDYNPYLDPPSLAPDLQVAYVAGNGISCADESHDIFAGSSATFTVLSRYAPSEQEVWVAKFVDDLVFGDCGDFGADPEIFSILAPTIPPEIPALACDFDGDGDCDVVDIDALAVSIVEGTNNPAFDLTNDALVTMDDLLAFLHHESVNRLNGDADLDGSVDFRDFLKISGNFGKSAIAWSAGNFVPSESVDFTDFLTLSANFGATPQGAATAVPEPNALWLLALAMLSTGKLRRKDYS